MNEYLVLYIYKQRKVCVKMEKIDPKKSYGLVFTGGGTRGCYEIGAWKALKELNINITAVVGTSIGAINGAFFVQNDFDLAYSIWTNVKMEDFINASNDNFISYIINTFKDGGLDVSPLKSKLNEYFKEEKIRNSSIDYGLVTYSLSDVEPVMAMKKDIPEGKIIDYIMASASFPLFKPTIIDGKKYIDGAVYDNVPVPLLQKSGIKDIIVIHISGIGIDRNYSAKKLGLDSLHTIRNSSELCGVLEFDNQKINDGILLGYLDTLKAFGKLNGAKYFLSNTITDYENSKLLYPLKDEELIRILDKIQEDSDSKTRTSRYSLIKRLYEYSEGRLNSKTILQACLETTAELFEIRKFDTYTGEELYEIIIREYKKVLTSIEYMESTKNISEMYKALDFNSINKKNLVVYLIVQTEKDKMKKKHLQKFVPKVYLSYLFLEFMKTRDPRI
jgi:NTE family protein